MRVKVGSELRSINGHLWRVTFIDAKTGLVELKNRQGISFNIPMKNLKSHGKKIGLFSRWFGKERKR